MPLSRRRRLNFERWARPTATLSLGSGHSGCPRARQERHLRVAGKPDIRLSDAINNEVEIAPEQEAILVYDWAVPDHGRLWRDLQAWFAQTRRIPDDQTAKEALYRRLKQSLPSNSPPQQEFFRSYHSVYRAAIPHLPALLPEVWLHWDWKTVRERGVHALTRHRMDFLLLLPRRGRVVIEIDGRQHYAGEDGMADPQRYARMAAGDRDLRLTGYEVYRFGAAELHGDEVAGARGRVLRAAVRATRRSS